MSIYLKTPPRNNVSTRRAPTAKHKTSIMASDHNSTVPNASGVKISKDRKIKYEVFFNEILSIRYNF